MPLTSLEFLFTQRVILLKEPLADESSPPSKSWLFWRKEFD